MPEAPFGALPVPATPIWQLKGWHLEIWCSRCRRHTMVKLSDVTERFGREIRVIEVVRRLRCDSFLYGNRCGAKPSRVILVELSFYSSSASRLREVTGIGRRLPTLANRADPRQPAAVVSAG